MARTDKEQIEQARHSAETWLELIDSGQFGESWEQASKYLKNIVPKDKLESSLKGVITPLGELVNRELKSAKYMTDLPGAPDGEYVVFQYKTSYQNKKKAIETITPMKEEDGFWKVSGYYIK
jgi:hypothetical protein